MTNVNDNPLKIKVISSISTSAKLFCSLTSQREYLQPKFKTKEMLRVYIYLAIVLLDEDFETIYLLTTTLKKPQFQMKLIKIIDLIALLN